MKSSAASIIAMAAMAENMMTPSYDRSDVRLENLSGKYPEKPLPKGCYWYYYSDGYKTIASSHLLG